MTDEDRSSGFLNYLPAILWQRRWVVIPPLVLLSAAGIAAAALWPTTYRSSSTILVEAQELPSELVSSPVTSVLDQRIAKIRQQVLSRGDLIALIEQNGLYEEERRSEPLSQVVDTMREAVAVQAVSADIGQTSGGSGSNTIAFTMSFDYRDAVKAQAVMQALVERFLAIDTTETAERATGTVSFLQDQARSLQQQIAQLEQQTTAIKARNGGALANIALPQANTGSYDAQIASLQSENRQLVAASRRQVSVRDPAVAAAEAQLAAIRARYSDEHPDVAIARARLAEIRALARANAPASNDSLIQGQIAANNATIQALSQARAAEAARGFSTIANQSRAPAILEQVAQLDARTTALREQYDDVAERLLAAQNSARMATEQRGERLTVIDPPVVPDDPESPSPWLMVLAGIALGIGVGVLLAVILEMILRPIRGVDQIEDLGLEPLAVVPTFKPDATRRRGGDRGRADEPVPVQA